MILNLVKINKMTKLKLFDELKNYKAKAEYYIRQHQDNIVIAKTAYKSAAYTFRCGVVGRDSLERGWY